MTRFHRDLERKRLQQLRKSLERKKQLASGEKEEKKEEISQQAQWQHYTSGTYIQYQLPPTFNPETRPEPKEIPKEIVASPIRAWRAWRISGEDLCSLASPIIWDPKVNDSSCLKDHYKHFRLPWAPEGHHHSPERQCYCGFWGMRDELDVLNNPTTVNVFNYQSVLIGEIEMWGKVIEHTMGFRAQYARIASREMILYKKAMTPLYYGPAFFVSKNANIPMVSKKYGITIQEVQL